MGANRLHTLEGRGGALDIEAVADPHGSGGFRSAESNFGYSRSAFWLTLDLDVSSGARWFVLADTLLFLGVGLLTLRKPAQGQHQHWHRLLPPQRHRTAAPHQAGR